MRKKLTKHGNSLALVIEKPILELLNIGPDTELEITTNGRTLTMGPADHGDLPGGNGPFLTGEDYTETAEDRDHYLGIARKLRRENSELFRRLAGGAR